MTNTELARAIADDLAAHDRNDAFSAAKRTSRVTVDHERVALDAYHYVMAKKNVKNSPR